MYFDVYRPFVELLRTSHPTQQKALLNSSIENFTYSKGTKDKLRPFKQDLADLADRSRSFRTKK